MKKLAFLLVICFVLTGCKAQTLECVKVRNADAGKFSYKVTLHIQNNKLIDAKMENDLEISNDYEKYSEVLINRFKKTLETYEIKKGVKTDIKTSKDSVKTSITFDLSKMTDKDKKELHFDNGTKKSLKKHYESDGFKCK